MFSNAFNSSDKNLSLDKKLKETNIFNSKDGEATQNGLIIADVESPEEAGQQIWQGIKLEKEGKLKLAISYYRQAIELDPESAKAYQLLANALKKLRQQRQQQIEQSTRNKQKATDKSIAANNFSVRKNQAENMPNNNPDLDKQVFITTQSEQAEASLVLNTTLDEAERPNFSNLDLISWGQLESQSRNYQTSDIVCLPDVQLSQSGDIVLQDSLAAAQVYVEQALEYFEQKQWKKSIQACQEALRTCPNLGEAYKVWGNCLQKSGNSAEAIGVYAKGLEVQPDMAEIYCNLGSIYAKKKKWQQAIEHYQKSSIIDPHNASPWRNLARVWDRLREYEKSAECFLQALEIDPSLLSAKSHFVLANNLVEEGKFNRAIACYKNCIKLEPRFFKAYANLGETLEKTGESEAAVFYYKQLAQMQTRASLPANPSKSERQIHNFLYPQSKQTNLKALPPVSLRQNKGRLGQTSSSLQTTSKLSPQETLAKCIQHAKQQPNSKQVWLDLGDVCFTTKQWQNAIAAYRKVVEIAPKDLDGYIKLGKALLKTNDTVNANQAFYKGFSLNPAKVAPQKHYLLGNQLLQQKQLKQAAVCFQRALKTKPKLVDAYLQLGKIFAVQKHNSQAINCFRRAIALNPQGEDAYLLLGELFRRQQEYTGAAITYQQLVKQNPRNDKGFHSLGDILSQQEQWSKAIVCYQRAIALNPKNSWSYNNLGDVLLKFERWQSASEAYNRAISLNPDFVWSYQNLGEALWQQEKWKEAIKAYRQVINLNPDLPGTYYNLGDALGKVFRWEEAIEAYYQAIKLNSNFAEAYAHLGDALVRTERWDESIKCYEKAIEINPGIDVNTYRNLKEALDRKKYFEKESRIKQVPTVIEQQKWPYRDTKQYQPPATLPNGNSWPKISIVTPSYNQGEFIEETILSVINQNYPNVEYILVDGASTDQTMQIVERYRKYFSCVVSEPDRGQSNAINKGFSQATGEIFTWLNSDDRLAPGALYAVALAFHTSNADVVAGICQVFRDEVEIEQHLTSCPKGIISLDEILDIENCWLKGKFFYQPEVMFTRAIWEKAGGKVEESLYYSMDYEMWARFAAKGANLEVIGYPVAQYRMHEQQKTNTVEKYQPELRKTRDLLQKHFNLPVQAQPQESPTRERKSLKIVCLNDTGSMGGAGIAHQRIAQALTLAGHQVSSVAGTLDWSLTPVNCTTEEVESTVSSLDPDLLVIGNIHNFQHPLEILGKLSFLYPTIFVMHDQWLLTGRCGYTGNCEKYTNLCDAECPTWDQYPCLAPNKIANAFTRKLALLQNNEKLLILGDSKWLADWSRDTYLNHSSQKDFVQINKKFQHIYYGLDLKIFRPQNKKNSRRLLELSDDKFIIMTGSQSLDDERKGFKHLLQALEIANLPDVLVLCFGHDFHLPTQLNVQSIGYIDNPSLLASYYSAADLFVSPALEEAFGQTLIEAAACGTPVVGYGVGGVKEAVNDRVSGRIVNQKTYKAMAKMIKELYDDRSQLELLSKLAPWHIANSFSLTSSHHSIINAWENSGLLSELGIATVSKLAVKDISQNKFITIKGGIPPSYNSLPRIFKMDQSLQGSGWYPAENVNGTVGRWMTKLGTVIIEPIDSSCPLTLEVHGLASVELQLLNSVEIKINGNLISTTVQQQVSGSWICQGDIPLSLIPEGVAFLITIEVAKAQKLSESDSRNGSLLIESLLIKLSGT